MSELERRQMVMDDANVSQLALAAGKTTAHTIAGSFSDPIRNHYGELIFPNTFGEQLDNDDVRLYVIRRRKVSQQYKEFELEEQLHAAFWQSGEVGSKLIIFEGREGVGKSSLLRYYFDYYLHQRFAVPETIDLRDGTSPSIQSLFTIYVDLRRPNLDSIDVRVTSQVMLKVRSRFPSLSSEDCYAMWDRFADWNATHHQEARPSTISMAQYRAGLTAQFQLVPVTFVREALWYLTVRKNTRVSLILDNIDQLTFDVQRQVLLLGMSLLGSELVSSPHENKPPPDLRLWRVIIPLRPETLGSLSNDIQPFERSVIIRIPAVDENLLLERRSECLSASVHASKRQISMTVTIPDAVKVCCPVSNSAAVRHLLSLLKIRPNNVEGSTPGQSDQEIQQIVRLFCNSSNRRLCRVQKRILLNPGINRWIAESQAKRADALAHAQGESPKSSDELELPSIYRFVSAWLHGCNEYCEPNDADLDVLNLFNVSQASDGAFSTLIGPFVVHLLLRGFDTRTEIMRQLTGIGFRSDEVDRCLEAMHAKYFFRYSDQTRTDSRMNMEHDIVDAHWRLMQQPAYVDAMALVTPIPTTLRVSIQPSLFHETADFGRRTKSGLAFINQLLDDEIQISTWKETSERHKMSSKDFATAMNDISMPSIYDLIARYYGLRLAHLRSRGMFNHEIKQLNRTAAHQSILDLSNTPIVKKFFQPIIISGF